MIIFWIFIIPRRFSTTVLRIMPIRGIIIEGYPMVIIDFMVPLC